MDGLYACCCSGSDSEAGRQDRRPSFKLLSLGSGGVFARGQGKGCQPETVRLQLKLGSASLGCLWPTGLGPGAGGSSRSRGPAAAP